MIDWLIKLDGEPVWDVRNYELHLSIRELPRLTYRGRDVAPPWEFWRNGELVAKRPDGTEV